MLEKELSFADLPIHCPKSMRRWDMQMLYPTKQ